MGNTQVFWSPAAETMTREEIEKVQMRKIKQQIIRAFRKSPFYRKLWGEKGFREVALRRLELRKDDIFIDTLANFQAFIPTFRKSDLRLALKTSEDPMFGGLLTSPPEDIHSIYQSRGTTGPSTFYAIEPEEVEEGAEVTARIFTELGLTPGDFMVIGAPIWSGAEIFLEGGAELLSAPFLPQEAHSGMPVEVARPVYIVQLFKKYPLAVICTYLPYLLSVLKHCEEQKLSSAELFKGLKFMLIYGDLILPPLRDLLEEKLGGCKVYELHSIPEAGGYFSECKAKAGLHVFEDYCFVEIMDPEEDKVLAPGEIGELVITSLWSRATSYIHYRSGDFASLDTSPCSCGRSHARLTIWGRKEWTLSLNGKKVYNRDVEEVLYAYPETITKCYQYGKTVEGNLLVRTAYDPEKTADKGLLKESLKKAFQERKGIKAEIELIPPEQATFYQDRRFI